MPRVITFFSLLMMISGCSVIKSLTLVNKGMDRSTKIDLDNRGSYLSIKGELLDSKINSRSSKVIFNLKIAPKVPSIQFESDNVLIYIYESDSSEYYKIEIINNDIYVEPMSIKGKTKFRISARINHTNISEKGTVKKIGLKLPPILVGNERLDLGIIDFMLR